MENSVKSNTTNNPAITENKECSMLNLSILKVGVLLSHSVSSHFISSYFEHIG